MTSFDFTALLVFLKSLFTAFQALFEKLGLSFGGDEDTDEATGE